MRRLLDLLFILILGTAGCGGSPPEGPSQLTPNEKEEIEQHLSEVHQSEASQ